jgi:transposase
MNKEERKKVADFIVAHEDLTYPQIANIIGCNYSTITRVAAEFDIRRPVGKRTAQVIQIPESEVR